MRTRQTPTVRDDGSAPEKGASGVGADPLVLGRYRLGRQLGTGGFGTVYAARDERLEREVAVKVLPRNRVIGARFEREARAAARLSHPSIVMLYEAVVDDDGAYLVSELVRGRTLGQLLERGSLSDRDILLIAIGLCDALGHAHNEGVIHRDVKPSNILVPSRSAGSGQSAKLTDFGVARVVGGDAVTETGGIVGTLAYMAPEQAEGRDTGPAADLYSLALVIYEALAGVNPVRDHGPSASRGRRLATYLPPLRRQRRDLPRQLGVGLDRALRPRPRERGTLIELRAALVSSLNDAGDTPGIVAPGWTTTATERGAADTIGEPGPEWRDDPHGGSQAEDWGPGPPPSWPMRGVGATTAGLAAAWLSVHLLTSTPLAPAAVALVVAGAVLLLPRLGWLATLATLAGIAAGQGRTGAALILILTCVVSVVPIARSGGLWPLPGGAVVLGLVGLAGAWPAAIARSGLDWWHRATLAAAGFLWLSLAGGLTGRELYWRPVHSPPAGGWTTSPTVALHGFLVPLLRHGVLEGALIWALAGVVLPWLTTSRSVPVDLVVVTGWSAATASAVAAVGGQEPHGAVVGAVLAGLIALAPALTVGLARLRSQPGIAP